MTAASMGHATRLGIHTADPVTQEFTFVSCGIGKTGTLAVSEGIRGSRSKIQETARKGTYTVGGPLVLEPAPDDLDLLLPWLGMTENLDVFTLDEAITDRFVTVDKVAKVATYAECRVNRCVWRANAAGVLTMELDVQGTIETLGNAGTFPDIAATLSDLQPYMHHELVLTLGGTAYPCLPDHAITLDNHLLLDRHYNSQARQNDLPPSDRTVMLECTVPYTADETGLYDPSAAIAASSVYTNGNYSVTFSFVQLEAAAEPIPITSKTGEVVLKLTYQALEDHSAGTKELVITNDATG